MMTDPQLFAAGVSVTSNVATGIAKRIVRFLEDGKTGETEKLLSGLEPLFALVAVKIA